MRTCFSEHDIPSPRYALVNNTKSYSIRDFRFPLIVKPTDRSGSRGVEKVLDPLQLEQAVERARKESFIDEVIIEEFVTMVVFCKISRKTITVLLSMHPRKHTWLIAKNTRHLF